MSRADAISFVRRLHEDPALGKRVAEAGERGVEGIASELGLAMTVDEYRGIVAEIESQLGDGELPDEALDAVAGGVASYMHDMTMSIIKNLR